MRPVAVQISKDSRPSRPDSVWPGQALSYKVGMIKILELRQKAMDALGDKFSIKDFHSAILDHGIPPLFIVEQKVDEMIEEALNS